ncbi:hypothetical protein M8J77_016369 [Diaphorina citri]|nr:hypothetical protein M8J77_016369 [Diaphorina citri]
MVSSYLQCNHKEENEEEEKRGGEEEEEEKGEEEEEEEEKEEEEDPLEWLKYNCSPEYLLEEKWHRSFRERQIILQQKGLEYINEFPCLRAPGGYKLLADDFAIIHPDAHNRFTQKCGDIKSKILSRLHDHHSDKARNLIDLATVGEDEADVATFQAITYLLRRMHTFSVQGAKKKTVNPSRDQVVFVLLREPNMSKVSRNSSSHSLLLSALPGGKSNNMTSS